MKKIIGLSCGKINGNSETLLKAAAIGAAEYGIETEIIRAMELNVLPCKGCQACFKTQKCVANDDIEWILQKTMVENAGLIVSVPTYHIRANSYFMCINDKILHIFRSTAGHEMNIIHKDRVGAIIGIGGSGYDAWASLTLTMANIFIQHTRKLVDQIQVNRSGLKEWNVWLRSSATSSPSLLPGHTHQARCQDNDYDKIWELYEQKYDPLEFTRKSIERAKELGRNVARAMNMPIDEVKYAGEEHQVSCPVCHCNILVVPENLPYVGCPICWVRGEIILENGTMRVNWNSDDIKNPRYSPQGQEHHWYWLTSQAAKIAQQKEEIAELTRDIKLYGKIIKPD